MKIERDGKTIDLSALRPQERNFPWLQILDGNEIQQLVGHDALGEPSQEGHPVPWRAPSPAVPLLVFPLDSNQDLAAIAKWLRRYYPPEHSVRLIEENGPTSPIELDRLATHPQMPTAAFVAPLDPVADVRSFAGLMNLTRRLRSPGGCPWDREQTHASLAPHLIEETYEVVDALESGESERISEELGDLLFQVAIHAQIAAEGGTFTIEDVIQEIVTKLVGRHPHVFGDLQLGSAEQVLQHWESFKQAQKPSRQSVLEEIPRGMPALPQTNLIHKRVGALGFDWQSVDEVFDKVDEEIGELRQDIGRSADRASLKDEVGDVFFTLVGVARQLKIDPEEALRHANDKFRRRFRRLEGLSRERGIDLRTKDAQQLEALWREAKGQPPA